jgi:hypothetical protein
MIGPSTHTTQASSIAVVDGLSGFNPGDVDADAASGPPRLALRLEVLIPMLLCFSLGVKPADALHMKQRPARAVRLKAINLVAVAPRDNPAQNGGGSAARHDA